MIVQPRQSALMIDSASYGLIKNGDVHKKMPFVKICPTNRFFTTIPAFSRQTCVIHKSPCTKKKVPCSHVVGRCNNKNTMSSCNTELARNVIKLASAVFTALFVDLPRNHPRVGINASLFRFSYILTFDRIV